MVNTIVVESGNSSKGLFKSKFKVVTVIIGVTLGMVLKIYSMVAISILIFMFPVIKNVMVRIYDSLGNIGKKKRRR